MKRSPPNSPLFRDSTVAKPIGGYRLIWFDQSRTYINDRFSFIREGEAIRYGDGVRVLSVSSINGSGGGSNIKKLQ